MYDYSLEYQSEFYYVGERDYDNFDFFVEEEDQIDWSEFFDNKIRPEEDLIEF